MQIQYSCPACSGTVRSDVGPDSAAVACSHCAWTRPLRREDFAEHGPQQCLVCGCSDLWRQKDFPAKLGLALVALGAVLSTIAMAWYFPATALGILLAFALGDLVLYVVMPDVLVCYRCHARHRVTGPDEQFPRFNLETAERYRQEAARLDDAHRAAQPR